MDKLTSENNRVNFYQQLTDWLNDVKQHELTELVEFVEQAKAYAIAAESIPEEKIKQFVDNFRYDLADFYQLWQADSKNSTYLGLLNEIWWSTLAKMTDKSQVEWAEITDDFKHEGEYKQGDYIGFGELVCTECDEKFTIVHFSEVPVCPSCGNDSFYRQGLAP